MSSILLGGTPLKTIRIPEEAPEPILFAATELQACLGNSFGLDIPLHIGAPETGDLFISIAETSPYEYLKSGGFDSDGYDRCVIAEREGVLYLIGENPISALYAVYDFLQSQLKIHFSNGQPQSTSNTHDDFQLPREFTQRGSSPIPCRDCVITMNSPLDTLVRERINEVSCPNELMVESFIWEIKKRGLHLKRI